jgi:hypothetical protein
MILEDVPFDSNGNMIRDTSFVSGITRRTVEPFPSWMRYVGYDRRKSAFSVIWEDQRHNRWPMFWSDFDKMLPRVGIVEGSVPGYWYVVKRSGYYGIVYMSLGEYETFRESTK